MDKPVAAFDFAPESFPFHIEIIDDELGVVWETTIEDGPLVLEIPGFGPERAAHRRTRITYANGEVVESS